MSLKKVRLIVRRFFCRTVPAAFINLSPFTTHWADGYQPPAYNYFTNHDVIICIQGRSIRADLLFAAGVIESFQVHEKKKGEMQYVL